MQRFRTLATVLLLIAGHAAAEAPRLALQITVDGLRGDLLDRYAVYLSRSS